jgi:hypothetical protein
MRQVNKIKAFGDMQGVSMSSSEKLEYHQRVKMLMIKEQAQNQHESFTQLSKAFGAIYGMSETNARSIVRQNGWRDEIMATEPSNDAPRLLRLTAKPVHGFSQNFARSRCGLGC